MMIHQNDRKILRELGKQYAEIAQLDQQRINQQNWIKLNNLQQSKPMVIMDQLPWHELSYDEQLSLKCEDPFCRALENQLRQTLYKWHHMKTDMVVMPYVGVSKVIGHSGIGISIQENLAFTDRANDVYAHQYLDALMDEEALGKVHSAQITYDEALTLERQQIAQDIFQEILPVRLMGIVPGFRVWDELTMYRGVTPLLMDMIDRPEFIHAIMIKLTAIECDILSQYEQLNLLDPYAPTVHCSGAFMPQNGVQDKEKQYLAKDCWAYGMGQIFASCSPAMHEVFEMAYAQKYYERCGFVYYGCCEPLHHKIDLIRRLPHVRKISMSPWADVEIAAANIKKDYVLSKKPNPAFLATQAMDETQIKQEVVATLRACAQHGTPCEFILKDVSTIGYHPERLTRWSELVNAVIDNY